MSCLGSEKVPGFVHYFFSELFCNSLTAADISDRKQIAEWNNVNESYDRQSRLIMSPATRNRAFPTGNSLLYISFLSVAFGRVRPIQGRTLFLFHRSWVYIKPHHRNSL